MLACLWRNHRFLILFSGPGIIEFETNISLFNLPIISEEKVDVNVRSVAIYKNLTSRTKKRKKIL